MTNSSMTVHGPGIDVRVHFAETIGMILKAGSMWIVLMSPSVVLATPPSNSGVQIVNYTIVINPDAKERIQIGIPESFEAEEGVSTSPRARSSSNFVFQLYTANPNSSTGWHYHPGTVLATVAEGSVDWYDASCVKHVHKAGEFFIEDDHTLHEVRNSGSIPAHLVLTFIIAKGLAYKISAPAPPCASHLGLQ
jgi:quercetin dioxygenase-like cupin family protein